MCIFIYFFLPDEFFQVKFINLKEKNLSGMNTRIYTPPYLIIVLQAFLGRSKVSLLFVHRGQASSFHAFESKGSAN